MNNYYNPEPAAQIILWDRSTNYRLLTVNHLRSLYPEIAPASLCANSHALIGSRDSKGYVSTIAKCLDIMRK